MTPQDARSNGSLRFLSGWRILAHRTRFLLSSLKYLAQRRRYPLFSLSPRTGLMRTFRIGRELGLRKVIRFGDSYFTALTMPHYPSRAYDHMVAGGGLNCAAAGTDLKRNIDTAILAITRTCHLHCQHCYERFNIGEEERVPISTWKKVIEDLQRIGTNIIVLSGGEPMLRYEGLLELLEAGDPDRSDFHMHTSGLGVTEEKAKALKDAGLIAAALGLDDVIPERHDKLRGRQGSWVEAVNALGWFHDAGVFTYVNMCPTRELIRSGDLWRYFDLVKSLNVGFIQLLEPRPCGGYFDDAEDVLLTEADRKAVMEFFVEGNHSRKYRDHPLIYYVAYTESPQRMGCMMGGLSHFTIDSLGNVNPCVFLPVTFGNIMQEDFSTIFRRMREAIPGPLHRDCPSLSLSAGLREEKKRGARIPVRYESIKADWDTMYCQHC